jgi:hypothetical protein
MIFYQVGQALSYFFGLKTYYYVRMIFDVHNKLRRIIQRVTKSDQAFGRSPVRGAMVFLFWSWTPQFSVIR